MLLPHLISSSLGASVAVLPLTILLSIPHVRQVVVDCRVKDSYSPLQEESDEEDITTTKPPKAIWQRITLVVVAGVAAIAGFPFAIISTNALGSFDPSILRFIAWLLILLQELILASRRGFGDRYRLGCYTGAGALAMGLVLGLLLATNIQKSPETPNFSVHDALAIIQLVASAILLVVNLSIPKGPTVHRNGCKVDEEDTVSFLNRYSFAWAQRTLSIAAKNGRLNAEDLPEVSDDVRARALSKHFAATSSTPSLWRKWARIYWKVVVFQVTLQVVANMFHFLPHVLLLLILRLFEERDAGANNQGELWLAGLALGLSMMVVSWFVSFRDFTADLKLSLPVNEQLFAVITEKAMRLKDIVVPVGGEDEDEDDDDDDDSDAGDEPPRTKHSILNLLGVDVEAISDFIAYSHILLDCVLEFIATMIFLVYLIGWKPTLAGCAIPFLMTPVYYLLTKRYSQSKQVLMDGRDGKSAVLTEMVRGMRQIKFSALELEWFNKVGKLRTKELNNQRSLFQLNIALIGIWTFGPLCMSVLSLAAYIYFNGTITPSVAFTALSIFEGLQNIIGMFPEIFTDLLDASVSVGRVEKFLSLPEHHDDRVSGQTISFRDATISWPSSEYHDIDDRFQLKDLDIDFPSKQLSIVSGRSGAGKSLLLHALIGEAEVTKGTVVVPHANSPPQNAGLNEDTWLIDDHVAYVSQDPWIENATIRDSILFGLPLHQPRYNDVLAACALTQDLKTFAVGDMTDIGANGINLSGGQKWRLAFARALYSRAGVLILDDVFSAVDSHVGNHLYEQALTGKLSQGRTRVLATHHVKLALKDAAYWVSLENGRVVDAGSPKNLLDDGSIEDAESNLGSGDSTTKRPKAVNRVRAASAAQPQDRDAANGAVNANGKKYYEEEKRERGVVKMEVYKTYLQASGGYLHWLLIVGLFLIYLLLELAAPYWVSIWTRSYDDDPRQWTLEITTTTTTTTTRADDSGNRLVYYGGVYLSLAVSQWLLGLLRFSLVMSGSIKASKVLFDKFTQAILHAPIRFMDTTPVGQVLNRFTSDFGVLDSDLAENLAWLIHSIVLVLGVIVAALVTSPLIVGLGGVALVASWGVAYFYVTGAREVKRIESTAKSPIFELVGSLLTGMPTIRAFSREQDYIRRMYELVDAHCKALWHRRLFPCWMAFWLSMVGACFVAAVTIMFVNIRSLDAPLAGFALSFALQMSDNISWFLAQYAQVELDLNTAERIIEYTGIEQEPQTGIDVPAAWPTDGELEVEDLFVGYAPDQPPVLKGLTFSIRPGERVGVVGRTGAGKSSLAMTLLRCLEARAGSIHIDGIDITSVRLRDLRSRLGIISQDPIVFAGTVREVLDPFDQHEESELRDALEKVALLPPSSGTETDSTTDEDDDTITNNNKATNIFSLSFSIAEGGRNLSQGQRQLLCLARALVSRPKILIMDEATASIDMESDIRIQRTLREEIRGCTLLVIAHRLSTIADFDRVLVLDEGRIAELDRPAELMGIEDGIFRGLVEQSGERAAIEAMIFGGEEG